MSLGSLGGDAGGWCLFSGVVRASLGNLQVSLEPLLRLEMCFVILHEDWGMLEFS